MGLKQAIDITTDQQRTILALLRKHLPYTTAWVYGSRVKWASRPQSDLDMVVFATPEQNSQVFDLREALEESNLPFRVDLFVWDDVPERFRKHIKQDYVVFSDNADVDLAGKNWLYHPQLPRHWKRKSLYAMAQWVNGLAFREIQFSTTGKPVIKIAEIKGGISGQTKFTQQTFDESVRIRSGDLLFSWSGQPETSIDAFWWRGPEGWLNQHVFRVTPINGVDSTFFFYLLRYLKPNFVAIARNKQTTGLGHVTKRDLENIEAALPDLSEQRAIADILGTLDDKIELNKRMIETLEEMARALFKSLFVDFDPVRAKAALASPPLDKSDWTKERARAYLDSMDKSIVDLFPDRLVESEIGEIPEGWEVGIVSQLAEKIQNGGTPKRSEPTYWVNPEVPWLTSGEVRQSYIFQTENFISREGLSNSSAKIVPARSILVALYGATAGQVSMNFRPLSTNQAVSAIVPFEGNRYYCLMCLKEQVATLAHKASGSAQQNISKRIVELTNVLIPPPQVTSVYDVFATRLFDVIFRNLDEISTLTTQRNTLLPKLVSGELHFER